ncbi:unnamed protein product [Protopolystoma xenopodis]|uniref:Uncharacterized protein n=1 Tax=Protopolystoma xenopodis TaxID=117903 RepID=A0A448X8I4_9PLAT|nr:unnamed protein product [Protopolystoma xenopodis]
MVSNLQGEVCEDDLDKILTNIRRADVQLSLLGMHIPKHSLEMGDCTNHTASENPQLSYDEPSQKAKKTPALSCFKKLLLELDGDSYEFEDVVSALSKFELRAVAQRGWKISLEIGPSFKLPIVGFTQIKEALPPPMREYSVADLSHSIQFANSYQYPDEPEKRIDISDTVRGE